MWYEYAGVDGDVTLLLAPKARKQRTVRHLEETRHVVKDEVRGSRALSFCHYIISISLSKPFIDFISSKW